MLLSPGIAQTTFPAILTPVPGLGRNLPQQQLKSVSDIIQSAQTAVQRIAESISKLLEK